MSTIEAVALTVVAFFLAGFICIPFAEAVLLVPLFLVAWFLIAVGLAVLYERKKRK